MKVLLATRNVKKLDELRRILASSPELLKVELVGLDDVPEYAEVPETGLTFAENALLKAREGAKHTGLPTVADDSGLAVDALNGMPGVFSARWSGRHGDDRANLDLVLGQIGDVPDEHRGAAFVCAAALVLPGGGAPNGREHLVSGKMTGRLLRAPRGEGGFGYDPIFVAEGNTRTNAELEPAEKDAISHRGKAFRSLAAVIAKNLT
ncbi:non-canonical purine NTP pyrophosphatase [Catellatospora sp. TT07R-123]|uniref:RdgB/HAM1 family non-canonical purine NTP pyrophosphatase n=1 Tax=Catellatospora sp. TT07R-123 TaxID=2733863 RepID=UPI001B186A6C|nr:RdgB/HAM1 family non-canonical purine NTP pyrophosphatase [Catellatospora sp. TT07R-123]GHJ45701.1 non-canonical purine NTP pyrophosphatase [Catellatospora sp. TT07R-123]